MREGDDTDRVVLRRYLLRQLSEREMEEVETRYFGDAKALELVEAEANALSDDWVGGSLSPDDTKTLEALRETPFWRDRLAFAQSFRRAVVASASAGSAGQATRRSSGLAAETTEALRALASWLRRQGPGMRLVAAGAGLVLIMGWPMAAVQRASQLASGARNASESDALSTRVAQVDSLLVVERQRASALEEQVAAQTTSAFMLTPGIGRSEGTVLAVPRSASFVELELATETPPRFARYRVAVSRDGQVVWSQSLAGVGVRGSELPAVRVPALALSSGTYRVELMGEADGSASTPLANYGFTIARR